MRTSVLAPLSLSLLGALASPTGAQEAELLKREIDRSVHWLRWQGRNADGTYGKGVLDTATTLLAFARSPRAYGAEDGPWIRDAVRWLLDRQRPDGSFEEGTETAVAALEALDRDAHREAIERARTHLESRAAAADVEPFPLEKAREVAEALRKKRGERGDFDGSVAETARAVLDLSRCWRSFTAEKGSSPPSPPAPPPAPKDAPAPEAIEEAVRRGAGFLLANRISGLWGFAGRVEPGISALAAAALASLPEPRPAGAGEAISKTLEHLASLQRPNGAITEGGLANYVTSVAVLAFVEAGDERYRPVVERAQRFLTALQCDEGEGYSPTDRFYGGIGYGDDERPDLSNLNMALDALRASGLQQDHRAFRNALLFLERCQNRSESNAGVYRVAGDAFVAGNDGGAAYFPGNSPAGTVTLPDGRKVARSYGSMTYALLKGFLFAGLPKEDPRVQAAWEWLRKRWTLEENPGFDAPANPRAGYQGYYYYLYTAARTLDEFGEEVVEDAGGKKHAWRAELASRLLSLQRRDGSWSNEIDRWWEGSPALVTAYALLALRYARG